MRFNPRTDGWRRARSRMTSQERSALPSLTSTISKSGGERTACRRWTSSGSDASLLNTGTTTEIEIGAVRAIRRLYRGRTADREIPLYSLRTDTRDRTEGVGGARSERNESRPGARVIRGRSDAGGATRTPRRDPRGRRLRALVLRPRVDSP